MGVMTDVQTVAANTFTANILAGKTFEFCQHTCVLRMGIVAAAVGVRATIMVGEEVLVDDQEVPGSNRFPIDPDDLHFEIGAEPGDRIVVKLRNTTGAGIVVNTLIKDVPLGMD